MPDNNAAKSVHQYLLAENIQIDLEEFTFQAKTHPDYPSVLAYSDTLHFFGISNKAVRLDDTAITSLPEKFIALMVDFDEQEMLAFVQRKDERFQYSKNGKLLRLNHAQFEKDWKGVILLVEGQEEPSDTQKITNPKVIFILFGGLALLVAGLLWTNGVTAVGVILLLSTAAGLYLSVLATNAQVGMDDGRQPLFCTNLPKTDCNAVIASSKGKLYKQVAISDACMVFFTAQLLALLFFWIAGWLNVFYTYTLVALLAALPLTFYSLYVQVVIEKKWCTICIAITGLLYLQLGIVAPRLLNGFSQGVTGQLVIYLAFFITTLGGWLMMKGWLTKYGKLKQAHKKAIAFKRNYELFRYSLLQSKSINIEKAEQAIVLGNSAAALQITLVTNPYCGFCAGAHQILVQLLKSYGGHLSIAIRFNYTEALNAEQKQLHWQLVAIYHQKGPAVFIEVLGEWFAEKDYTKWVKRFASDDLQNNDTIYNWLQQQAAWNQSQELNFTPAFLIGPYLCPMAYEREDLLHFIPELLDDASLPFNNPLIDQ